MKKLSHKLKITLLVVILGTLFLTLLEPASYAEEDTDRSIYGDYLVPVFHIELSNGQGTFDSLDDLKEREALNTRIANGQQTDRVSLFDRFGSSLEFIGYYGEKNFSLNVVDNIYTKFVEDGDDFKFNFKDLFYSSDSYFNTEVYYNRPYVLTDSEIKNGSTDPRNSQYGNWSTGGSAALGNFYLKIAEFIVDFSTFFISGKLFDLVFNVFDFVLKSDVWKFVETMVKIVLPLALIFVIIKLTRQAIKVAKGDINNSKEGLIKNIAGIFISFMIIFTFIANPTAFNGIVRNGVSFIDDFFANAASEQLDDDVISSSNTDNVMRAMVWKTAILNPWCNGMFQDDYDNLYTQFETDPNKTKMNQTHQEKEDDKTTYDSATLTGDIQVKLGNNRVVRNWCALAWSTGSKYHINADGYDMNIENGWPGALHTAYDASLYVDTFRWVDAKLNISPIYKGRDSVTYDYINSNPYKETFVTEGVNAAFLALLSLFILPLAFKRIINLVFIIGITIRWILGSLKNMVLINSYDNNIFGTLSESFRPIKNYLWYTLLMFMLVSIYTTLAGKGFIENIVYVMFAFTLNAAKPPTSRTVDNIKEWAKDKVSQVKDKTKEKASNFESKQNQLRNERKQTRKLNKQKKSINKPHTGLKK